METFLITNQVDFKFILVYQCESSVYLNYGIYFFRAKRKGLRLLEDIKYIFFLIAS